MVQFFAPHQLAYLFQRLLRVLNPCTLQCFLPSKDALLSLRIYLTKGTSAVTLPLQGAAAVQHRKVLATCTLVQMLRETGHFSQNQRFWKKKSNKFSMTEQNRKDMATYYSESIQQCIYCVINKILQIIVYVALMCENTCKGV